ncbi:MAG: translocation/assembly module TamB domain-containing protein [Acidobacteriota bacterium]
MKIRLKWQLVRVFVAGVLLVALIGLAVLHTPPAKRYAFEWAQEYLRSQGWDLEGTRLDYNLFTLEVTLQGPRLRATSSPSLPPLAEARELYLNLRWIGLFTGYLTVQEARVSNPKLAYVLDERGHSNVAASAADETDSTAAQPFWERIASMRILQGSVHFEDRERKLRIDLPLWDFNLALKPDKSGHELSFSTGRSGEGELGGRAFPIDRLALAARLERAGLKLTNLQLQAAGVRLETTGSLEDFADPMLDLAYQANVDLEPVSRYFGIPEIRSGNVVIEGSIVRSDDRIHASSRWQGDEISAAGYKVVSLRAQGDWDSKSHMVRLESLSARLPDGAVEAAGVLNLTDGPSAGSVQLQFRHLDIEPVTRLLGMPVQLACRATGAVSARWQDTTVQEGEARISLKSTRSQPAANVLPLSGEISARSRGSRSDVAFSLAPLMNAALQGEISVGSRQRLGGNLDGTVDSLAVTLQNLGLLLGQKKSESLLPLPIDGKVSFRSEIHGTLNHPNLAAALSVAQLQMGEVKGAELQAEADLSAERILLRDLRMVWEGQALSGQGTLGLTGSDAPLAFKATLEDGSLGRTFSAMRQPLEVEGKYRAELDLSGVLAKPDASVDFSATSLQVYGESMGDAHVRARWTGEALELSELLLEKDRSTPGEGRLTAQGWYRPQTGQYELQAEAHNLQLRRLTLPGQPPWHGTLSLSASGSGTLADPSGRLQLDAHDLQWGERPVGSVNANAVLANKQALLELKVPYLSLSGTARLETQAPYPSELEVVLDRVDLSQFELKGAEEQPLTGTLSAVLKAAGALDNWKEGRLSAQISRLELSAGEHQFNNDGVLELDYQNGVFAVGRAAVSSSDSRIEIEGRLPVDATSPAGALAVRGRAELGTLLAFVPLKDKVFASGLLDLDLSLQGSLSRAIPKASVSFKEGFFYDPALIMPFTDVGFSARLEDGSVILDQATGQWALGTLHASGEVPVNLMPVTLPFQMEGKPGPARFSMSAQGLQADSIRTLPRDVAGTISVRIDGQASKFELPSLSADAVFDELRFQVAEYAVSQSAPSKISLQDGQLRIDQFRLTGPTTQIEAAGQAHLGEPSAIDLRVNASLDAGVLTFMSEDLRAGGRTDIRLEIEGDLESPEFSGFLQTRDAEFNVKSPRIQAEKLNLLVRVTPQSIRVDELKGTLNGGNLSGGGTVDYSGTELKKLDLKLQLSDVFLNIPEGLRTSASADLTIQSPEDSILIAGSTRIAEGSYRDPVELGDELLRNLAADQPAELEAERDPFLSRVRYNVAISTVEPILIDNNLAKLAVDSNLRLVGTYYRPALTGRLSLGEGGEIYLNERKYLIDRGVIDFISQNRIEPSLDILAKTQAGGEDIDLQLSGTFKDLTSTLTSPSDPDLSEPDIVSLLLTGRRLEEFRGAELNVAKEQVLSYLAGRVGGRISRTAEEAFGLSQVRIEPNLIAAESDPGARLTVGQDVTRDLRLIYSMDLTDSQDQIWTAEYDLTRRFEAKATKQSDNSYRYDFRHDLRFGGHVVSGQSTSPAAKSKMTIAGIEFLGKTVFPEEQLGDQFKLKAGDKYDFFKVQNSLDRVQGLYAKQGYPEAKVRLDREPKSGVIDLKLNIESGPRVEFVFEGREISSHRRKAIEQTWREGVFDAQRAEESVRILRRGLVEEGFLQPKVTYSVETPADDLKQVVFQIESGAHYRSVELVFEGAGEVQPSDLESQILGANLKHELYLDPEKVRTFLETYYRQQGYLDAEIQGARFELEPQSEAGRVVIPVKEGRPYQVGRLQYRGNKVFSEAELNASVAVFPGQRYRPDILRDSTSRLEELYWNKGYNDVVITAQPQRTGERGVLDLAFNIVENRQGVIAEIQVEGNQRTSTEFVRSQLKFSEGDVLDFDRINRSRKTLYDAGAYSLVDLEAVPLDDASSQADKVKRVHVTVKLREIQPYQVRYGAFFDTERGPGIILDATTRNFLGSARVLGLRTRFDGETREVRGYFSQPFFRGLPLKSNLIGFRRREAPANVSFVTDRVGFSLQQEARLRNRFILSYGYRLDRTHTFDREPDPLFPFDITLPVARLTGTLTRENRDDLLDASRGSFTSHAFEFAPQALGSDIRFVKYFGQYFKYVPLSDPTEIPWNDGLRKSRLVYAGGVRLGLAKGLGGQDVISFERFFAGGGTTIRGFDQNRLGPVDFFGDPAGGEAVFITNNELRFPIVHIFDGVGFLDIGNVYPKVSDFDLTQVRKSAGFGLRVRTPFFLLRVDYGFKLDRRPEESRGGFFFSIGQAF